MQDLLSAGVHFGHKSSRAHPKMKQYIFGARDGVDIIDLAFSEEKLKAAVNASYELGKAGKVLLIVGTKKQAKEILESLAKEVETPYLTKRWYGGLLTNFEEIMKNFKKLTQAKEDKEKGVLAKTRTKKEQLLITKKLEKFDQEAGGVSSLEKIPDALFVVDAVSDNTAIKEALKVGIPIIGLCDTNADPFWFDYPVPSNDDGIKSIKIICESVIKAYGQGKKEASNLAQQIKDKEESDKASKLDTSATLVATNDNADLTGQVAEETAAIEEVIEKKIVGEQDRHAPAKE